MRPRKKTYRRKVTSLVDATPTFVSVVDRGANGSPFTSVKRSLLEGEEDRNANGKQEDIPMKVKRRTPNSAKKSNKTVNTPAKKKDDNSRPKTRESVIVKFMFDGKQFKTEDAVQKFMDESDFEGDIEIQETDNGFVVVNKAAEGLDLIRSEEIDTGEKGVIAEVGAYEVAKTEEEDDGDDDDSVSASDSRKSASAGDDSAGDEAEESDDDDASSDEDEVPEDDELPAGEDGEGDEEDAEDDEDEGDDEKPRGRREQTEEQPLTKREAFLRNLKKNSKENVAKFDHYEVWLENAETDFANLLKKGMSDGAVPGFEDVMWTFSQSVRKTLRNAGEGYADNIRKDANDLVSLVIAQSELFESILNADSDDVKKADAAKTYEDLQKWATAFGESLLAEDTEEKPVRKQTRNNAVTTEPNVVAVVNEHITPLAETVNELTKTVEKLASRKQISKALTSSEQSADEGAGDKEAENVSKRAADEVGSVIFGKA